MCTCLICDEQFANSLGANATASESTANPGHHVLPWHRDRPERSWHRHVSPSGSSCESRQRKPSRDQAGSQKAGPGAAAKENQRNDAKQKGRQILRELPKSAWSPRERPEEDQDQLYRQVRSIKKAEISVGNWTSSLRTYLHSHE